jgi:hypothetical protein
MVKVSSGHVMKCQFWNDELTNGGRLNAEKGNHKEEVRGEKEQP